MATAEQPNIERFDEAEEHVFLEQHDQVSDEALAARVNSAPECGGERTIEFSEVLARRSKGAC